MSTEQKESEERKDGKRLLSVEEAAAYLGISPRTVYNGVSPKAKNPFPVKVKRWGKRVLFDIQDLDRYIEKL
jgi:predicted DNA-binding transcriptional regulator AlpA